MPAKGSCCNPCSPCEAELDSCSAPVCLQCAPRRLCATVTVTPGEGVETCCPGNTFTIAMLMECGPTQTDWGGEGNCGTIHLLLALLILDNGSDGGCSMRVTYGDGEDGGFVDVTFTSFPLTAGFTFHDVDYSVTFAAATGIEHPWNGLACNPCVCQRCLPAGFCAAISKGSSNPNEIDCDPCYAIGSVSMRECDYTGTIELLCGEDTYTIGVSLPSIESGQCGIRFTIGGPGVDIDIVLGSETVGESTNGCYKCCQSGINYPMSRIGNCRELSCSDCYAEDPDDDNGCGVATLNPVIYSYSVVIEEEGVPEEDWKTFRVTIREQWCGERCTSNLINGPQCCFRMQGPIAGAEHCHDNPTSLGLSFIAPQCDGQSPDNDGTTLTLGTMDASTCGDSPFQAGWTASTTFHACDALATADIILYCDFPADCEDDLEPGEYCEFAKLLIITGGNSLGINVLCLTPTFCSCDPLFFEFEAPMLALNGADPEGCPDWCEAGGTMIIRVTE